MINSEAILNETLTELYPSELFTLPTHPALIVIGFILTAVFFCCLLYFSYKEHVVAYLFLILTLLFGEGTFSEYQRNEKFILEQRMKLLVENKRNFEMMVNLRNSMRDANKVIQTQAEKRMNP